MAPPLDLLRRRLGQVNHHRLARGNGERERETAGLRVDGKAPRRRRTDDPEATAPGPLAELEEHGPERELPRLHHRLRTGRDRAVRPLLERDQIVQLLRRNERGPPVQIVDVPTEPRLAAIRAPRVAETDHIEQRGRAAVVQVGRGVPDVGQHRRHVVEERSARRRDRRRLVLEGSIGGGDDEGVGQVEEVLRADRVAEKGVVGRGPGRLGADEVRIRPPVREELGRRGGSLVARRALRLRVVEETPAALGRFGGRLVPLAQERIPGKAGQAVDEVGDVRQTDTGIKASSP